VRICAHIYQAILTKIIRCGKPGHFARECTNADTRGDARDSRGGGGGAGGGGGGGCYRCGESGHFARYI
jgi:hypothetical protein